MLANRDDYREGGVKYFPLSRETKEVVIVLPLLSLLLLVASVAIYFSNDLGVFYLIVAGLLGVLMVFANWRLLISGVCRDAWRVYKLSAFPYLGPGADLDRPNNLDLFWAQGSG